MAIDRTKSLRKLTLAHAALLLSAILRIVFAYLSIKYSRYIWGDTGGLLLEAQTVCGMGQWGGSSYKPPLYAWLLCLLSEGNAAPGYFAMAPAVVIIQSTLSWLMGYWLYRRSPQSRTYVFWMFDPGLILYGSMIMSDSLYAVWLMGALLITSDLTHYNKMSRYKVFALACFLAGVYLQRSNGFLAASMVILCLIYITAKYAHHRKAVMTTLMIMLALLSPRIIYSLKHYGSLGFAGQGAGWLTTVAAVAEFAPQGYDFITAERKWVEAYGNQPRGFVFDKLKEHSTSFLKYSLMGTLRTLFGHLNVETGYLMTGKSVIGPALTRPAEPREGPRVAGLLTVFWILGLTVTLLFTAGLYARIALAWLKNRNLYSIYFAISGIAMATVPLVFGDGRFRLGVWPFFIAALLTLHKPSTAIPSLRR
jgi:hypothetical protein